MAFITRKRTSNFLWSAFDRASLAVGDEITEQLNNGNTVTFKALDIKDGLITIGMWDTLYEDYCMNDRMTNEGGWEASELRRWLNDEFYLLLPEALQAIIKPRNSTNKLWLLSEREVCGYSKHGADDGTKQMKYFENPANRESEAWWWTRTPQENNTTNFVVINEQGEPSFSTATLHGGVCFAFYI